MNYRARVGKRGDGRWGWRLLSEYGEELDEGFAGSRSSAEDALRLSVDEYEREERISEGADWLPGEILWEPVSGGDG